MSRRAQSEGRHTALCLHCSSTEPAQYVVEDYGAWKCRRGFWSEFLGWYHMKNVKIADSRMHGFVVEWSRGNT